MNVVITGRKRRGEYWVYSGAVDGERLRDTLDVPVEYVETRSAAEADEFVKRKLKWLHDYLKEPKVTDELT